MHDTLLGNNKKEPASPDIKPNHDIISNNIIKALYKDESQEAKSDRRRMMMRAALGEFICTFLFFTMLFGVIVHAVRSELSDIFVRFYAGLTASFSTIAG